MFKVIAIISVVTLIAACGQRQTSDKAESDTSALAEIKPASTATAADSVSTPRSPIEGIKEFRLGMNLEDLKRLRTTDFDGANVTCTTPKKMTRCVAKNQRVAGVPVTIYATFVATGPIQSPKFRPMPPKYVIDTEQFRLNRGEEEMAKEQGNYQERKRVEALNAEASLKSLSQFSLAEVSAEFDLSRFGTVMGALVDRYGAPAIDARDQEVPLVMWKSNEGELMLVGSYMVVKSIDLASFLEEAEKQERLERAADL